MPSIIEHIRNKPQEKRDRFIWICAGLATAVLLVIWIIVGNDRKEPGERNFFETFGQSFNQTKDNLKEFQK